MLLCFQGILVSRDASHTLQTRKFYKSLQEKLHFTYKKNASSKKFTVLNFKKSIYFKRILKIYSLYSTKIITNFKEIVSLNYLLKHKIENLKKVIILQKHAGVFGG